MTLSGLVSTKQKRLMSIPMLSRYFDAAKVAFYRLALFFMMSMMDDPVILAMWFL